MADITYLDAEHGARPAPGRVDGERVLLDADALGELTGWQLKPEGLCRDEVCVPVRDPELAVDGAVDVARFAAALARPVVVDAANGVVALGERSADRRGPDRGRRRPRLHAAAARRRHVHVLVARAAQEAAARVVLLVRLPLRPAGLAASQ